MKYSVLLWRFVVVLSLFALHSIEAQTPHWDYLTKLNTARRNYLGIQHAVVIAPCKVLVAGGYVGGSGSSYGQPTSSCEIIDACCARVTPTGSMIEPRSEHILLLTPDSNVVAISGMTQITDQGSSVGVHTTSVEMYNRSTGTWSSIGNILTARRQAQGVFINSNEILIVGGRLPNLSTIASAEVFNISTGTSTYVSNYFMPVNMHNIGISSNGLTVVAGGRNGGTNATRTNVINRFDRSTNTFTQIGTLSTAVRSSQILKLFDNRLLITGGVTNESAYAAATQVMLENGGSFSSFGNLNAARWGHGMGLYTADSCIVFGGNVLSNGQVSNTSEWIRISSGQINSGPTLPLALGSFSWATVPTVMGSGGSILETSVLVIGGVTNSGEFGPAVPRDSIYVLRRCTEPDSIRVALSSVSCLARKLSIDSIYRCRIPAFIKWNFGDATTAQTTSWSVTHTFPNVGRFYVSATLFYTDCADTLRLERAVDVATAANILTTPKILVKCAKDTVVQLHASGGVRYLWSPGSTLNDSTSANPIAHPTQDTRYVVTGWTADSCRGSDTILVRVSSGKANAGPDLSMCSNGDSVTLAVSISGVIKTVKWTPKFGLSCDTCPTTVARPTTTTSYIATVTDTAGCVYLDTIRVSLRNAGSARISGGPTMSLCAGSDSITLSLTTKVGVRQVKWTPNIGISCDTCIVTKVKPKTTLKYTVQITDSLGCVTVDTILVKVGAGSSQIQSGGPQYICYKGDSAVISVNGKVKAVLWSPASLVSCSTCPQTLVKPTATRYFSFTAVDSAGCTLSDSIKVTVLPKSTVDIAPDTTLCGSTALLMNVYGQYQSINWSPAAGLSCTNCPTVLVTPTPGKTITYYVTAHNGKSVDCDSRDSIRVRFAPGIEGQLADQSLCPGDSIVIKLRPFGGKVKWSSTADNVNCDTCRNIVIKPTKNGKFVLTGDSLGCISRDTFSVTLAPTTLSVPKSLSACAGRKIMMGATTNSGTVHWSPPDDLSCTDCPNPVITTRTSRTYYVTAGHGNCTVRDSVVLDVKPSPQFLASPLDTIICNGQPVSIKVQVQTAGTTVTWDPNSDLQCYNCTDNVARPSAPEVWYTAHLKSPSGCDSSFTVHIVSTQPPKFKLSASAQSICEGDSLQLILTNADSAHYTWSTADGSNGHIHCDTCQSTLATPTRSLTYIVRGSRAAGCEKIDSVHINVNPRPIVSLSSDTSVCSGTAVPLHVGGGDQVRWDASPDISCTTCRDIVVQPENTSTYRVHVGMGTNPDCWRDTSVTITTVPCNVKLKVQSTPIASFFACDSAMTTVQLLNEGDVVLRLDSVAIGQSSHASVDKTDLQSFNATLPKILAAKGGTLQFPVHVIPSESGPAQVDLVLYCKDSVRTMHIAFDSYNQPLELNLPAVYNLRADTIIQVSVNAHSTAWSQMRLHDSVLVRLHIDSTALVYLSVNSGSGLNSDWTLSYDSVKSTLSTLHFIARGQSTLTSDGTWLSASFKTLLPSKSPVQASVDASFPSLRVPCADQNNKGSIMTFSSCVFNLRHVEYNPGSFGLQSIQPNPAENGRVTLRYGIGTAADARIMVYSMEGRLVAHLASGLHQPGSYELELSTTSLSPGEYLVQLEAFGQVYSKPLVIR